MTKRALNAVLTVVLGFIIAGASAGFENPIQNPSFETGAFSPWTAYSFIPGPPLSYGQPAMPIVGAPGTQFNLLGPYTSAHGTFACGMESGSSTSKNGGVYQSFFWTSGSGTIRVSARVKADSPYSSCSVRVGVAPGNTSNRSFVTQWFSASNTSEWTTISVPVPATPTTHTLFIEGYQPSGTGQVMSTIWDNVKWVPDLSIVSEPANTGADPLHPDTTAMITWVTNLPSNARVDYRSGNGDWQVATSDVFTNEHIIMLTNLQPSTECVYRVSNSAPGCSDVSSGEYSFITPVIISGVSATTGDPDVVVTWHTDVPTDSYVDYGLTTDYGQTVHLPAMVTGHSVTLTGLQDGKTYHYRVRSGGGNYNTAVSGSLTFRTLPAPRAALQNGSFEHLQGGVPDMYPWDFYLYDTSEIQMDGVIGPYPAGGTTSWFPDEVGIQAYDGSYFLGAGARYIYKNGGVYQRIVLDSPQTCALTARFATYQSPEGGPRDTRVDIGIDPTGGMNPNSPTVHWWRGISPSNDNRWHTGGVVVDAPAGVVTLFLGTRQLFGLTARAVAIDDTVFGPPQEMKIGELRNSRRCPGVILKNVYVTCIDPVDVIHDEKTYRKIYVQEEGVPAGVGVLLGPYDPTDPPAFPAVGNKITVTGALMSLGREAVLMGYKWTGDGTLHTLPAPLAAKQRDLGGRAFNQAALNGLGPCNVGLRVKVFGRITWPDIGADGDIYLDDGSGLPTSVTDIAGPVKGLRVRLRDQGVIFFKDDYIAATGVLTIENTGSVAWPNHEYVVVMSEADEWQVLREGGNHW